MPGDTDANKHIEMVGNVYGLVSGLDNLSPTTGYRLYISVMRYMLLLASFYHTSTAVCRIGCTQDF